jgi:AraC-like DNA-binding protein
MATITADLMGRHHVTARLLRWGVTVRRERRADCDLVREITHVVYDGDATDVATPDGGWDLVFMTRSGVRTALHTGLITRPVDLGYTTGDEYVAITFRPGVFMPAVASSEMVDRGVSLGPLSAGRFRVGNETLEAPTFENAESLVQRLVARGVLALDEVVDDVVQERGKAITPRTVQRHFERAVGVTAKQLSMIYRARDAARLLGLGRSAADVALQLGYSDQAHMTRSLKHLLGRTPSQLARKPPP